MVRSQFATRGITVQKTKFDYVVSSLGPKIAVEIRDLLLNPPTVAPYDRLKVELVKRTAVSEQQKLQQLISGEELRDRKPSQLLRRMQQLLGQQRGSLDNPFLKELFLQRLPPHVRMVLAAADTSTDLNKLADMADKIFEVTTPTVSAVQDTHSGSVSKLSQLNEEVTRLTELVASVTTGRRRDQHQSFSRRRRSGSPAAIDPQQFHNTPLCWYHRRFGERASKCQHPCGWGNSLAGR